MLMLVLVLMLMLMKWRSDSGFFSGLAGWSFAKDFIVLWGETQRGGGVCVCVCVSEAFTRLRVYVKYQELYGRSYSGRKPF